MAEDDIVIDMDKEQLDAFIAKVKADELTYLESAQAFLSGNPSLVPQGHLGSVQEALHKAISERQPAPEAEKEPLKTVTRFDLIDGE
jgi:hypothetical protein